MPTAQSNSSLEKGTSSTPRYRADQVGSFLRPPELIEARRAGDPERLREIEDRAILRVLAKQKELGFEVFTDGEFRRSNFMGDFTEAVEGIDFSEGLARTWKAQEQSERPPDARMGPVRGIVVSKLRQVRPLTGHELPFLKKHSPGDIKMTLPSATQFPAITFKHGTTDKIYKDHSALLWEIVEIIKTEVAKLAAEGVKYIQIDAPRYSYYMDPKWRDWIRTNMKVEPDAALDDAIKADNACFKAARRPGVTLGIHLCRGNSRSHWYAEGGYDPIAEKLFGTMDVDRFLLEYEDPRSGTFEPLRFVPKNKTVVLGLISSKVAKLESGEEVVKRIHEAAKYFPLENLALSPQCGFASTLEGNLLTEDEQWAKLRLVVETARRVWG
ncbi:MAG: cobalamin-independent methionine synthase II family protein [Candidatus Acidiferrales bacterium]|jgi:5-methyltetrahydropteroyltriglutamate--homocysteine methyltransferase